MFCRSFVSKRNDLLICYAVHWLGKSCCVETAVQSTGQAGRFPFDLLCICYRRRHLLLRVIIQEREGERGSSCRLSGNTLIITFHHVEPIFYLFSAILLCFIIIERLDFERGQKGNTGEQEAWNVFMTNIKIISPRALLCSSPAGCRAGLHNLLLQ